MGEFLTVAQAAERMHISQKTVRKLLRENKLRYSRPGSRNIYIRADWIEEYMTQCTSQTIFDNEKENENHE